MIAQDLCFKHVLTNLFIHAVKLQPPPISVCIGEAEDLWFGRRFQAYRDLPQQPPLSKGWARTYYKQILYLSTLINNRSLAAIWEF